MFRIILLLLIGAPAMAQTDSVIKHIREQYQVVNAHIGQYRKAEVNMEGISTEGAVLEGYYAGDTLKLLVHDVYGEMYRWRLEIYYEAGKPIFCYRRLHKYAVPIYESTFTASQVTVDEDRTYFKDGKMIRWIDDKNKTFQQRNSLFIKTEKDYLKTAVDLRKVIKTGRYDRRDWQ